MPRFRAPSPITQEWLQEAYSEGLIPKKDFIDGAYYSGHCRNASVAKWNATRNKFQYVRTKFTSKFVDEVEAVEDDVGFDLFYPTAKVAPEEYQKVENYS